MFKNGNFQNFPFRLSTQIRTGFEFPFTNASSKWIGQIETERRRRRRQKKIRWPTLILTNSLLSRDNFYLDQKNKSQTRNECFMSFRHSKLKITFRNIQIIGIIYNSDKKYVFGSRFSFLIKSFGLFKSLGTSRNIFFIIVVVLYVCIYTFFSRLYIRNEMEHFEVAFQS
jgi:hypothetical protein